MKKTIFGIIFFNLFFLAAQTQKNQNVIVVKTENLPVIESLSPSRANAIFQEYQSIIENNNKAVRAGREPEFVFFLYKNAENFTFQALAARCCVTQETLATLNKIDNAQENIKNKEIILPTVNGLFISLNPNNALETLLYENYLKNENQALTKNDYNYNIKDAEFVFLRERRFTSTERAYFLDSALRLPLDEDVFTVSSEFGKRKNPFSGQMKNHNGIDLAAPEGTPVYAVKDGAVYVCVPDDAEFGNYVILSHDAGKTTSVYAHLKNFVAERYQNVKKGEIIGFVGQTGMATGPHLHFEIRQGGKAEDPRQKLKF